MSYDLLKQVIGLLEDFEQETGNKDLTAFSEWLYQRQRGAQEEAEIPRTRWDDYPENIDVHIAMSIGGLNAHAKHYIKTALKDSELKGMHDFTFLATLVDQGDLRKTDLIALNMLEFSPGMEVIRRLLRNGFIEDYDNPEDGRSRRVSITAAGKAVFFSAMQNIQKVNRIVVGNLTEAEKQVVLNKLRKLMAFHQPIWDNEYGEDLEKIMEKHILGA
ncbi:MarR family winged helix-turn-helix transcriptional regulator [Haliscomenobacter hydrossis]|uniref:Regulatory protein MarR n=1 Tax=Haliscomenobacter hydrossis (strain ATCC 27775 / DSM 1100 / LMG 10767 / O) TaxID=760192 RepID=F4KX70_HALH1|nr:MarR family winged helix-turn-helix transcriptional regulator [Haliscomenobacter hydrossis]AEE48298.1 regulatory protein MarR [Haliscomenobacter hydrossis DSM 1100]